MPAKREQTTLLLALSDRDIAIGSGDVAWAYNSERTKSDLVTWSNECLTSVSLLTQDEMQFVQSLSTGALKPRSNARGASIRPFDEGDLKSAIAALQANTESIERQCGILAAQKRALTSFEEQRNGARVLTGGSAPSNRWVDQTSELEAATDQLLRALQGEIHTSSKQGDVGISALLAGIDRLLEKDDRFITGLHKLLPRLYQSQAHADVPELDRLCHALSVFSSRHIRARMDAAYRRALQTHESGVDGAPVGGSAGESSKQAESLLLELEELSGEIDSLVGMAVENRYRAPILRGISSMDDGKKTEQSEWGRYIGDSLEYLTRRLTSLTTHIQQLHAHQHALRSLSTTLSIAVTAAEGPSQLDASNSTPVITALNKGLKPLRLVQENFSDNHDPAIALVRHLSPTQLQPSNISSLEEQLERLTHEGHIRTLERSRSGEAATVAQLAGTLRAPDGNVESLQRVVHSHSPFASIRLSGVAAETGLSRIEADTQALGKQMRKLDVERLVKSIQSFEKE